MQLGTRAAVEVGRRCGIQATHPILLQETNNVVVWLAPEAVVAKVAIRTNSQAHIRLEHAVATELSAVGAEIAAPLEGFAPIIHDATGFLVTLWELVPGENRAEVPLNHLAESLRRLHSALQKTEVELPSFRQGIERARTAADDDLFMSALGRNDRRFLRQVYRLGLALLDENEGSERRLHGEPHDGNRIVTAAGVRWIDFESCCVGPLEWDLPSQSPGIEVHHDDVDTHLLSVLRRQ